MDSNVHDYLPTNRRLASRLVGCRLTAVTRLLHSPPDEDLRFEWGPALLTGESGQQWLLEPEESKANILISDPEVIGGEDASWFDWFGTRIPIADVSASSPLNFLLTDSISLVEVINRAPEPGVPDSFEMSGIRLTTTPGCSVCVGTHLTDLMIPGVWFLLPDEVDPNLGYTIL